MNRKGLDLLHLRRNRCSSPDDPVTACPIAGRVARPVPTGSCRRFGRARYASGPQRQDALHGEFHPAQRRDRRRPPRPRGHHPLGLQRPDRRHFRHFRRHLSAAAAAMSGGGSPSWSGCRSGPSLGAAIAPRIFAEVPATLPAIGMAPVVARRRRAARRRRHADQPRLHLRPRGLRPRPPVAPLVRRRRHLHGDGHDHRLRHRGTSSDDAPRLRLVAAAVSGIIFGIGLAVARMTDPQKVKDFLDIAAIPQGGWDPSLAFVMGGAALVAFFGLRLDRVLRKPLAAPAFTPVDRLRDRPAAGGRRGAFSASAGAFPGFCPGPAIADLGLIPSSVAAVRRRDVRRLLARRALSRRPSAARPALRHGERMTASRTTSSSSAPGRPASPRRSSADRRGHDVAIVAPPRAGRDERTAALLAGSVDLLRAARRLGPARREAAPMRTLRIVDATRRLFRAPEVTFHASEIGLAAFGYNVRERRPGRRPGGARRRPRHPRASTTSVDRRLA